jgi:hypothetical protein
VATSTRYAPGKIKIAILQTVAATVVVHPGDSGVRLTVRENAVSFVAAETILTESDCVAGDTYDGPSRSDRDAALDRLGTEMLSVAVSGEFDAIGPGGGSSDGDPPPPPEHAAARTAPSAQTVR